MKDLISARKLKNHVSNLSCDTSCDIWGVEEKYIDKAKRIPAIKIPKNATNLDMLKKVLPKEFEVKSLGDTIFLETHSPYPFCKIQLDARFANAPYEKKKHKKLEKKQDEMDEIEFD